MNKRSISLGIVFSVFMTGLIFILGFDRKSYTEHPIDLYQVYLNGEVVGVVENQDDLYDLIDKEQNSLKSEYDVEKIYPPVGLELMPIVTYEGKTDSAKNIYEKIKGIESFTLKGYEVTIINSDKTENKIFILNEEDLDVAIDNTIKSFVSNEILENYRKGTQTEIADVGTKIENISVQENIVVKEAFISTSETIFTNANDLSKYLLFGTLENQDTYTVTSGDTIKSVAGEHGLNINEFLIANPTILSENTLLFPGQIVNIGLIDPVISIVVERTSVQRQTIPHGTTVSYDEKIRVGTSFIEQVGVDGESKSTYRIESVNGADTSAVRIDSQEIKPAIEEIIVKGGLSVDYMGDATYWGWPTIQPYVITSLREWRWGKWHAGVDIAGCGYNSPIYAIQSGVVVTKTYNSSLGNYIYIDHQNGYYSLYAHLATFASNIYTGAAVVKGQQIAGMGSTGFSTGTHLHFGVWKGFPYRSGSYDIDPLDLYD